MSPSQARDGTSALDSALVQQHLSDGARREQAPGRAIAPVALPEVVNHTPFPSQYFQSVDQYGTVFHVVALRVTYDMRSTASGGTLAYAREQTELATQDQWSGAVNESSPLWESDFAPYKPKCDVLVVNAVSRAPPQGQAAKRWPCGLALQWSEDPNATGTNTSNPSGHTKPAQSKIQSWAKKLSVTGPRHYGMLGLSEPRAAGEVAISWQNAFGGQHKRPATDEYKADGSLKRAAGTELWKTDERNPVGVGLNQSSGESGPQIEALDQPYSAGLGQGKYPPVGLSALGKTWLPRRRLAGTYDNAWLKNQWPLPPMDFDYAYWNCAPQDQQVDYLPPGTKLMLLNLFGGMHPSVASIPNDATGTGKQDAEPWSAQLPMHQVYMAGAVLREGKVDWDEEAMNLDTLVIDLAAQQVYAIHRFVLADNDLQGQRLLSLETHLAPPGQPKARIAPEEFGPLG